MREARRLLLSLWYTPACSNYWCFKRHCMAVKPDRVNSTIDAVVLNVEVMA